MTPIEAAAEAAIPRKYGSVTPTPEDYETARRVITAFLDAAAGQMETARSVGYAANDQPGSLTDMGRAAILKLKDAVNG